MTVDKCFSTENFTNKVSRACLSYVHIFTLNINLHQQPFLSLMFASELCLSSCFHYARSCFSYKTCVQLVYTLRCTLPVCDLTLQCCWYPRTKLNNTQGLNGKLTIYKTTKQKNYSSFSFNPYLWHSLYWYSDFLDTFSFQFKLYI